MNECRKTMTVVEFNRIVTRSLLWGCKKKMEEKPCQLIRDFLGTALLSFFGEIFSFAKSVLCYSWQFCVAIGWPKLRICGAEHPIHRPDSISIPFQTPTPTQTQIQTHKPNPRPHDLQLPVAGLFTKPWTWRSRALPHGLLDLWAGRWMSGTPSFCVWDKTKQNKIKWS